MSTGVVSTGPEQLAIEQYETWTYLGVRVGKNNMRMHRWEDPDGVSLYYKGRESYVIGGLYSVIVTRTGSSVLRGEPVYTGRQIEDRDRLRELWAESKRAEMRMADAAAERKHKAENPFDDLLDPLVAAARKLGTQAQKDALITHVLRRLYAAW